MIAMTAFLLQQLINALTVGSIYALIALGYTMVYGVLKLINFAHSELFMLGAYAAYFLLAILVGPVGGPLPALIVTVVFFATFALIGTLGVAIERTAYRPLRRSSRLAPMLSALGMAIVLQNAVMLLAGRKPIVYAPIFSTDPIDLAGAVFTRNQVMIVFVAIVLMLVLTWFIHGTRLGIRIRAVSESGVTAQLLGINIDRTISVIFFIGPGLGALAGILYASYYGVATYSMGFIVGMKAFTAAILGGIGSIPGAMLGGFLLGLLEVFGAGLLPILSGGRIGPEYRDIFAFAILIGVLVFRPAGLLSEAISEESLVYKRDF
jgi:branched-chain amino acid transport system permease protein